MLTLSQKVRGKPNHRAIQLASNKMHHICVYMYLEAVSITVYNSLVKKTLAQNSVVTA